VHKINIKPLSVNDAWQGKRFQTPKYKKYIKDMMIILPRLTVPESRLSVVIEFGFATAASDIDNACKQFIDCISKKFCFNDNRIYHLDVTKCVVGAGNEYIKFDINEYKKE